MAVLFVVKNFDNSSRYLRQSHRSMELHNDGIFIEQDTDYVLMMKIFEQHIPFRCPTWWPVSCCPTTTSGCMALTASHFILSCVAS